MFIRKSTHKKIVDQLQLKIEKLESDKIRLELYSSNLKEKLSATKERPSRAESITRKIQEYNSP